MAWLSNQQTTFVCELVATFCLDEDLTKPIVVKRQVSHRAVSLTDDVPTRFRSALGWCEADRGHRRLEGLYCYANVRTNRPKPTTQKTSRPKSLHACQWLLLFDKYDADTRWCWAFALNELVTDSTEQPDKWWHCNDVVSCVSLFEIAVWSS